MEEFQSLHLFLFLTTERAASGDLLRGRDGLQQVQKTPHHILLISIKGERQADIKDTNNCNSALVNSYLS